MTRRLLRREIIRALGSRRPGRRKLIASALALFALAFVVRSLHGVDLAPVMYSHEQPGTRMAARYHEAALLHLSGDGWLYPRTWPDRRDTALVSRPPGYPLFVASTYRLFGPTAFGVLLVQALLGSALPVALLMLLTTLLGFRAGLVAGLLSSFDTALAWHTQILTPDSLGTLLATTVVYLVWRNRWRPRFCAVLAGLVLGSATWLRPNFFLLAPFFAMGLLLLSPRRRKAVLPVGALLAAALLVVAPVTVRNLRIYGEFVPVSTNMGIVLWEGIADAGGTRFGARSHDFEVAAEEAKYFGDTRYASWWASPDGIRRDRERVRRALAVIRREPSWFAVAALRRLGPMLVYGTGGAVPVESRQPEGAIHEQAGPRSAVDERLLAPGRLVSPLRFVVRTTQRVLAFVTPWLALSGIASLVVVAPRRLGLLLLVPLYHVATQAPLHFEPRFVLPMHPFVLSLAAAGLTVGARAAWRFVALRRGDGRR
jgi:4-amino-4-deoxy-L-arabinose transferase-like glycosyltransferase